ncbi:MAG: hypothetical protein PHV02_03255 [Rhodocyclaceae bacterium]|nr:hypothetical protein [Rhodocyclaceae bacterium]
MLKIDRSANGWELYSKATAKDVHELNRAANKAVLDTLVEMQTEGVSITAALNTALGTAREVFYKHAEIGAYDTEALLALEYEVTRQFTIK